MSTSDFPYVKSVKIVIEYTDGSTKEQTIHPYQDILGYVNVPGPIVMRAGYIPQYSQYMLESSPRAYVREMNWEAIRYTSALPHPDEICCKCGLHAIVSEEGRTYCTRCNTDQSVEESSDSE